MFDPGIGGQRKEAQITPIPGQDETSSTKVFKRHAILREVSQPNFESKRERS